MGKHAKPKVRGGKHAKPSSHPIAKKAGVVGAAAAAVPMAGAIFAAPAAHAATATQWNCIATFESGNRWHLESGDPEGAPGTGASAWGGGLQFQPASWGDAMGVLNGLGISTSHFGVHASSSTKQQQILAAEALEHIQGPSAWATNGMSSCATLSASMFNGGPNPWAAQGFSGSNVPASVIDGTSGDDFTGTPVPVPTPTPTPDPTPPPVPVPNPGHHWRHHHHHWKHGDWHKPAPAPVPAPVPVVPPVVPTDPAPPAAPASCDHVVVPGDTVSAVAASVGAPLADVEAVNPGIIAGDRPDNFSLIFAGGHIHMPAGFCASGK